MEERKYDLYSDAFRAATHETYAAMREHDPILRQPGLDGETPIWFLTRYDDVVAMLLDDERFVLDPALALTPEELEAQPSPIPPELDELINRHVLTTDGDDHRRLRRWSRRRSRRRWSSSCARGSRRSPTSSSTAWRRAARPTSWTASRSRSRSSSSPSSSESRPRIATGSGSGRTPSSARRSARTRSRCSSSTRGSSSRTSPSSSSGDEPSPATTSSAPSSRPRSRATACRRTSSSA